MCSPVQNGRPQATSQIDQMRPEGEPAPAEVVERDPEQAERDPAAEDDPLHRVLVVQSVSDQARGRVHEQEANEERDRQRQQRPPVAVEQGGRHEDRSDLHEHPAARDPGIEVVELVVIESGAEQALDRVDGQRRVEGDDRREAGLEERVARPSRPFGRGQEPRCQKSVSASTIPMPIASSPCVDHQACAPITSSTPSPTKTCTVRDRPVWEPNGVPSRESSSFPEGRGGRRERAPCRARCRPCRLPRETCLIAYLL